MECFLKEETPCMYYYLTNFQKYTDNKGYYCKTTYSAAPNLESLSNTLTRNDIFNFNTKAPREFCIFSDNLVKELSLNLKGNFDCDTANWLKQAKITGSKFSMHIEQLATYNFHRLTVLDLNENFFTINGSSLFDIFPF
jgi:Ran GTPase-activating protein (RanGAP) involved in mRNA processing and transport